MYFHHQYNEVKGLFLKKQNVSLTPITGDGIETTEHTTPLLEKKRAGYFVLWGQKSNNDGWGKNG